MLESVNDLTNVNAFKCQFIPWLLPRLRPRVATAGRLKASKGRVTHVSLYVRQDAGSEGA